MSLTLHYDFSIPSLVAQVGPTLSAVRASLATMVDADGYIRTLYGGEPRFPGATFANNMIEQSEELSLWAQNTNVTVSDNQDSYNGIALSLITDDATAGGHYCRNPNQYSDYSARGALRMHSCYVKAGTARYITVQEFPAIASSSRTNVFDTQTGTWTYEGTHHSGHFVQDLGSGYFRIGFIGDYISSAYDESFVGISSGSGYADASYSGSGDTIYAGGYMVESIVSGTTTPSTYIKTETTTPRSVLSGTSNGLLVEEARTNILIHSADLTQSPWTPDPDTLVVSNATIAPDGSLTACKIIDDASGGGSFIRIYATQALSTSTDYCMSAFFKADQLSWARFAMEALGALDIDQFYDLSNGVVGTPGADVTDSGIEDYGNGWYRCWLTFTSDASDTFGSVRIYCADGDNDVAVDRDGTSSIFVWGAQLEAGLFMSSYIPTAGASVTRNADDIQGSLSGEVPLVDLSYYAKFQKFGGYNANSAVAYTDDGGTTDRFFHVLDPGADSNIFVTSSVGDEAIIGPNLSLALDTDIQVAVGFAVDDTIQYVDGAVAGTDTTCDAMGDAQIRIQIGSYTTSPVHLNGIVKEVRFYDTRLTDVQLEDMSNGVFPSASERRVSKLLSLLAYRARTKARNLFN